MNLFIIYFLPLFKKRTNTGVPKITRTHRNGSKKRSLRKNAVTNVVYWEFDWKCPSYLVISIHLPTTLRDYKKRRKKEQNY